VICALFHSIKLRSTNSNNVVVLLFRISELISHVDTDLDGGLGPWELHDWMLLVERIVQRHVVEEQWAGLGRNASFPTIGWSDYQVANKDFPCRNADDANIDRLTDVPQRKCPKRTDPRCSSRCCCCSC
jgi:hypothetical protein